MIRPALPPDLDALVRLEEASFDGDRLTRASYRRLMRRDSAVVLVDEEAGVLRGSAVVLFRRGLAAARLYSIAVAAACRGQGIGRGLVARVLHEAAERHCVLLRLEVRADNREAIALYERLGFQQVGRTEAYYEDGAPALRFERSTVERHTPPQHLDIPYYPQTLDFTCGAACLMMALKHFRPRTRYTRALELELWRNATTIFMTSGIGGCSAEGLAATAVAYGLHTAVVTSERGVPFIDTVRSPEKKEVLQIVHRTFRRRLARSRHPIRYRSFGRPELMEAVDRGLVPILLVSGYRLYGEKGPHWVVVTGYDEHFIYIHDPFIPTETPAFDGRHVPIHEHDFTRMHRYGRTGNRTMVLVSDRAFELP